MRIVSLLPSATEIVCALGRGHELVGVTHSCDAPRGVADLPRVTRTEVPVAASSRAIDEFVRAAAQRGAPLYHVDEALVRSLAPDLIVTQGLCAVCAVDEGSAFALAKRIGPQVRALSLTPHGLDSTLAAIASVGAAVGADAEARSLVASLRARIERVAGASARATSRPRVAYLEWLDPPFSCGHWGPELVRLAGGREVIAREGEASRTLAWSEVAVARPDLLLVACCGLDTDRCERELATRRDEPQFRALPAVQSGRVFVADGHRFFSRPGPALVDSLEQLAHALHPALHPPHAETLRAWRS